MAIENDPSARMQLRHQGDLQMPGCCIVCGNGTCEEGYLDFEYFVDYHGTLYLCVPCVRQASEVIGYLDPDAVIHLNNIIKGQGEMLAELKEEVENARPYVDLFRQSVSDAVASGMLATVPAGENARGVSVGTEAVTEGSGDGESEVTKPAVSERGRKQSAGSKPRDVTFK